MDEQMYTFWSVALMTISFKAHVHQCKPQVGRLKRSEIELNLTSTHKNFASLDDKLKMFFQVMFQDYSTSDFLKSTISDKLVLKESAVFEGRRYLLSRAASNQNRGVCNMFCNLRGGYLVEIETKKEFDFLKGFIEPLVKEHKFLLTGGTKSAERSSWSYFESEKPISFFHWATREQPASAEPGVCIWLWRDGDWSYVEGVCDFNSYTGNERGFLCEIPQ